MFLGLFDFFLCLKNLIRYYRIISGNIFGSFKKIRPIANITCALCSKSFESILLLFENLVFNLFKS